VRVQGRRACISDAQHRRRPDGARVAAGDASKLERASLARGIVFFFSPSWPTRQIRAAERNS
jgi:hypothetical protein